MVSQPTLRVGLIAGDVIHNLRSSLDLLAWQLVEVNGGTPNQSTMFPIGNSREHFEGAGGIGRVSGASPDALKVLAGLKPYQGGNRALWDLHCLDISDKHRILFTVGILNAGVIADQVPWGDALARFNPPVTVMHDEAERFPLKDGDEIYRLPAVFRAEYEHNTKFGFHVAFGEGTVAKGEPLVPTLRDLASAIQEMVELFVPLL
jgi:hypothetical protein